MPSLTWKLKDPKSCKGCPCLDTYNMSIGIPKKIMLMLDCAAKSYRNLTLLDPTDRGIYNRPQRCIKELKE